MSITSLRKRIEAEYKKHKRIDWMSILARKLDAEYISREDIRKAIEEVVGLNTGFGRDLLRELGMFKNEER